MWGIIQKKDTHALQEALKSIGSDIWKIRPKTGQLA
jgi:hypothetical protein